MKPFLLILTLAFVGCAGDRIKNAANGCVPRAIGYQDSLAADAKFKGYRWSRIVCIEWTAKTGSGSVGHAFCAFEYANRIMAYDETQGGSWSMTRDLDMREKPLGLAALWCGTRYAFRNAYFLDNE